MSDERIERKLSAILAADVAGYSRLMGADEEGTLAALTAHRRELFDPILAKHRGRIVKTTGDGLLAEFASVVDAVRCAVEVQAGMAARNAGVESGRRLDFRIGINVGDIVEQGGDIFGDGVNIAARLEGIADPGGICVSARVHDFAGGRIAVTFEDMGEQSLKNIANPVRAYRIRPEGTAVAGTVPPPPMPTEHAPPERPSLAVLPFQNMSADREQEYFADGIVEDIITALSRFRSFAVVARNSSFVYKDRAVDVRHVARDLGVRYVLEGSVRRAGQRLRITAQLVDAASGSHLWAGNFDGTVEDVFDAQDRITESVATIVEPHIRQAEVARSSRERSASVAAYDLYLRALPKWRNAGQNENAAAFALLQQALALEPNNGFMLALALDVLSHRSSMGWKALSADDDAMRADLAHRALNNAHDDAAILASVGYWMITVSREYDLGAAMVRRALDLNPNQLEVVMAAGISAIHCGNVDDALSALRRATRLSPADPYAYTVLTGVAHVHMIRSEYAEALAMAEQSLAINPTFDPSYWMLIAANAHLGRLDESRYWLQKFRGVAPGVTIASIRDGQPAKDPARMAAILEGLRIAGLEEG